MNNKRAWKMFEVLEPRLKLIGGCLCPQTIQWDKEPGRLQDAFGEGDNGGEVGCSLGEGM
jgi:hypothetical protein